MKSLDSRYQEYLDSIKVVSDINQGLLNDTQDIKNYLPQMIESIPKLSNSINDTLSESVKIQRDSTDIFDQLSGDIRNALTVISQNADRLESLNSRYESYSELVEKITHTNQNLLARLDQKSVA